MPAWTARGLQSKPGSRQGRLLRVWNFKHPRMEITPLLQGWVSPGLKCSFSPTFSEIPAGSVHQEPAPPTPEPPPGCSSQPSAPTTKAEPFPQHSPRCSHPQSRHSTSGVTSGVLTRGEASPPSACSLPSCPSGTPEVPPAPVGHQE